MTESNKTNDKQEWHLDRRLPVGMIITILFQCGGGIWLAAQMDGRVDTLETQHVENLRMDKEIYGIQSDMSAIRLTLIRIETHLEKQDDRFLNLLEKDN